MQNRGVSVVPYAIRKVVTADGRLLYQHQPSEQRVLVAPWVAAGMTDLLQSAVLSGTGRAAQIGRPVAGKTGTTSSNKDGWFVGFSSGMTTGVWMGRDDARPVAGLQGGTAPARAFAEFMKVAVAKRPVEQFETQAPMPDWQLEPDEEAWGLNYVEFRTAGRCRRQSDWARSRPIRWRRSNPAPAAPRKPGRPAMAGRGASAQSGQPAATPLRSRAPPPRPRRQSRRPTRFSRGPSARSSARAAATSPPYSSASSARNAGPWFMWRRWATSCATTQRSRWGGARTIRQL